MAELERDERTGDLVAVVGSSEVRLCAPKPGRSEWWELRLNGEGRVYLPAEQEEDALARALALLRVLDASVPLGVRVSRAQRPARAGQGATR